MRVISALVGDDDEEYVEELDEEEEEGLVVFKKAVINDGHVNLYLAQDHGRRSKNMRNYDEFLKKRRAAPASGAFRGIACDSERTRRPGWLRGLSAF